MAQEAEVSIRRELDEQRATDMNSVGILAAEGGQNRGAKVLAVDGALPKLTAPQNATTLCPAEVALDAFPQPDDHDADQMVTDRPFPKQFYKQDANKDDAATVNSVGYENQDLDPGDTIRQWGHSSRHKQCSPTLALPFLQITTDSAAVAQNVITCR